MSADLKPAFIQYIPELHRLSPKWLPRTAALALTALVLACAPPSSAGRTNPYSQNEVVTPKPIGSPTLGPAVPTPDLRSLVLPTIDPPAIPGHDLPGIKPTFEREDGAVRIQFYLPQGEYQPSEGTIVYLFKPNSINSRAQSLDDLGQGSLRFKMITNPMLPGLRIQGGLGLQAEQRTRLAWDSFVAATDPSQPNVFRLIWENEWKLKGSTWNGVPLPVGPQTPRSN